ncbi:enolase superfamily enzyme related to L-alanine-DL-glutamate epimerase [Xylanibacter oryzae DSM 17970]|uniref:Enolase superfamily enzyme related to L-alanine-DL-glutamate epimerase n=1 Tax=Xylanibacter oryzae DSM 17970 TaxID=915438 RepID=A0ABN0RUF5_9BACT|nr:o-succinylbenzoate synthase [Xylanibacter oryzae]EXG77879.1 enolase superfamily enzyme related to L-alanine-DL-glutamate epimerase [Xylanibacter oryzae DSM 17970]
MEFNINISEKTLHFKQPAGTSRGIYTTRHSWFITITSPEKPNIKGIGECAPLPNLSCDDIPEYENILKALCQHFCLSGNINYDIMRPYPSMLFGLESALQQFNRGGSECLFDTRFGLGEEGIPINGLVWMGSFDEMLVRIEDKMKSGFRCIKLKIGAIDFEKEIGLIRHIREYFTTEQIELRVDANGGFTPDNAMNRLERLAKYDIHSIEQPIKQHQWKEMAMLCKDSPLPIALDEELIGINMPTMKEALLDSIHPAYIILKPSLHGGMKGSKEWIELANQRGIGSWITSALESNIGLNAIAHFAAKTYGSNIKMPQGLGTGQLFTDNIKMPIEIRKDALWFSPNS